YQAVHRAAFSGAADGTDGAVSRAHRMHRGRERAGPGSPLNLLPPPEAPEEVPPEEGRLDRKRFPLGVIDLKV
ncbi:MAG: hypothetical protein ACE5ER_12390, partial [Nitrospinaceae bacterium]